MKEAPDTAMTAQEIDVVKMVAMIYGTTIEEASTALAKAGLARRVKQRTGSNPAKVYSIRGKK